MDGITDSKAAELAAYDTVLMPQGKEPDPEECVLLVKTQAEQSVEVPIGAHDLLCHRGWTAGHCHRR
ncbi:hypothetical protein ABZ446_29910 [Streptomyces sp. NPDC005813]|uniref:hypothetical protein n=1 Tax=Streptomyces sp. NPDC005813 TaxID=3155592 RepID=UPI0033D1A295